MAKKVDPWDGFEEAASAPLAARCGVALFLVKLDPAGATAVTRAMGNQGLTASGIYSALRDYALPFNPPSAQSIRRHRKGDCACPTS